MFQTLGGGVGVAASAALQDPCFQKDVKMFCSSISPPYFILRENIYV